MKKLSFYLLYKILFCIVLVAISSLCNALDKRYCDNLESYNKLSKINYKIYYSQKQDTIENISKTFRTTSQSILRSSNIKKLSDLKYKGCLIIPEKPGILRIVKSDYIIFSIFRYGVTDEFYTEHNLDYETNTAGAWSILFFPHQKLLKLDMKLEYPVKPSWISSRPGLKRHPITGRTRYFDGIRFSARYKSPVYSLLNGQVVFSQRVSSWRHAIIVKSKNGLRAYYWGLTKAVVNKGSRIKKNEIIGHVGGIAISVGPSISFKLMKGNDVVDLNHIYPKVQNNKPEN